MVMLGGIHNLGNTNKYLEVWEYHSLTQFEETEER